MAAADFYSRLLDGPLPYVQHHITVNKHVLHGLITCVSEVREKGKALPPTVKIYILKC